MGGIGSGNRSQFGKSTTTDMLAIDIRKLQREGWLNDGHWVDLTWSSKNRGKVGDIKYFCLGDSLTLVYRTRNKAKGEDWQDQRYEVNIEYTPCHYGGSRVWFHCPLCDRRVAKLYGGAIFACRHCHHLAYDCQRENDSDRLARKIDKVRTRLGWEAGILNGRGWKPKGMHWKIFHHLEAQHNKIEQVLYKEIMAYLGNPDDLIHSRLANKEA